MAPVDLSKLSQQKAAEARNHAINICNLSNQLLIAGFSEFLKQGDVKEYSRYTFELAENHMNNIQNFLKKKEEEFNTKGT